MVPVLTFHSIGLENTSWTQRYLSSPLEHFEVFCKYLKEEKYDTIFLDEWYDLQELNNTKYNKKIVITFDDGYLDNWVYVFPIIRKYGIKITIFVNPEFVDTSSQPRFTLAETWDNKLPEKDLDPVGFLNWQEMRMMEKSGLVDIQSHSMTHNTYFKSNKLVDLFDGSERYDWLPWIFNKDKKPYYMKRKLLDTVPSGYPIFEYDRSLSVRRFFPTDEFINFCITAFNGQSIKAIRQKKRILDEIKREMKKGKEVGRFENDDELRQRYIYEIDESKRIIEEQLNKKVRFLCWPGGKYNWMSIKLSMKAGYNASTASEKSENKTIYSEKNYKRIKRIGMASKYNTSRNFIFIINNRGLIYCFKEFTGTKFERFSLRYKRRIFQILF